MISEGWKRDAILPLLILLFITWNKTRMTPRNTGEMEKGMNSFTAFPLPRIHAQNRDTWSWMMEEQSYISPSSFNVIPLGDITFCTNIHFLSIHHEDNQKSREETRRGGVETTHERRSKQIARLLFCHPLRPTSRNTSRSWGLWQRGESTEIPTHFFPHGKTIISFTHSHNEATDFESMTFGQTLTLKNSQWGEVRKETLFWTFRPH